MGSSPLMLTPDERKRFAAYLEQEAATHTALADQMARVFGEVFSGVKKYRAESLAFRVVAKWLLAVEEEAPRG